MTFGIDKEMDKLYDNIKKICKDQLSEHRITKHFEKARNGYEFKYLVMKDYIDKLDFLRKGLL